MPLLVGPPHQAEVFLEQVVALGLFWPARTRRASAGIRQNRGAVTASVLTVKSLWLSATARAGTAISRLAAVFAAAIRIICVDSRAPVVAWPAEADSRGPVSGVAFTISELGPLHFRSPLRHSENRRFSTA